MKKIILFIILLIFIIIVITNKNKEHFKKRVKRIKFVDFWGKFDVHDNFFTNLLDKYNYKYKIVNKNPDIVIFSVFGKYQNNDIMSSLKNFFNGNFYYNTKKIFFTGEYYKKNKFKKIVKNADLNLTFQYTPKYNNIRLPLWVFNRQNSNSFTLTEKPIEGFCSFVYSNDIQYRNDFCKKLSKYKKIFCGGGSLNNIGYKVKDKIQFQKKYKFCIAFENHVQDGYTTEKIIDAYYSNCIPIYCGSKYVHKDFNKQTFINANDFETDEDLINYIIKVDNDDTLYKSYLNKPIYTKEWVDIFSDPKETYFRNIADKIIN